MVCDDLLKAYPQEALQFGVSDYLTSLSIETKPTGAPPLAPVGQPTPPAPSPPSNSYGPSLPQPGLNQPSNSGTSFQPSLK
jgi:hypothetical protein